MFLPALYTIAEILRLLRCPSTDKWIVYTHTHTNNAVLFILKKGDDSDSCYNMDGP